MDYSEIKNYNDRVDFILKNESDFFVFVFFSNESDYRKKIILNNPNFYKKVSPERLYNYVIYMSDDEIYYYLSNKLCLSFLKKYDYISTILERLENKKILKKLILNDDILNIIEEEKAYNLFIPFYNDDDIKNRVRFIDSKTGDFLISGDYSLLSDEEFIYLLNFEDDITDMLSTSYGEKIIKSNPDILFNLFTKSKNKIKLLKNLTFMFNVSCDDINDILLDNISDNDIVDCILNEKELLEKITPTSFYHILNYSSNYMKKYIDRSNITYGEIEYAIKNKNRNFIINFIDKIDIYSILNDFSFYEDELNMFPKYKKFLAVSKDVSDFEQFIKSSLERFEINDIILELKEEIKSGSLCKDLNLSYIMDYLYKNPDKEFPKEYFEIILAREFNRIKNENGINYDLKIASILDAGIIGDEKIIIDTRVIENSFNKNFYAFTIFFHELTHAKQNIKIFNDGIEYETLKQVKDEILRDKSYSYYSDNYRFISTESEAFVCEYLETIRYFYNNTGNIPSLGENVKRAKKALSIKKNNSRTFNDKDFFLTSLFDEVVTKKEIVKFFEDYPILKREYDCNGDRKSLYVLLIEYCKAEYDILHCRNKRNIELYKFYREFLNDILLNNTDVVNFDYMCNLIKEIEALPCNLNDNVPYEEIYKGKVLMLQNNKQNIGSFGKMV